MPRLFSCPSWVLFLLALPLLTLGGDGPPGSVSIAGERVPLSKALEQLSEQAKVSAVSSLDENPELKLSLNRATFWEAIDQIADAAGAQLDLYRPDGRIGLVRRFRDKKAALAPQISRSGAFRISLQRLIVLNDFTTGARGSTAFFEMAWEPSVDVFYLQSQPQDLTVQDDKGNPAAAPAGSKWIPLAPRRVASFDVALPALPRTSEKIGLLKGTIPIRGPSRIHTFRFPTPDSKTPTLADHHAHIMKEKTPIKESAGGKLTECNLNRITLGEKTWRMQITTALPEGGPDFESFEPWFGFNEVYLVSLDGKTSVARDGYSQDNAGTSKAVINYTFKSQPGGAKNWTLVFRAPASMIEKAIPFEFKNVPLP